MKKLFIYNCLTLFFAVMATFSFTACDDDGDDYFIIMSGSNTETSTDSRAVDLGLSVKWASRNIGATQPWEYGSYYAWGETGEKGYHAWGEAEEKSNYSWGTYKYCNGNYTTLTKYCTESSYGTVDYKTTLEPRDDVATVKWGESWRMPTTEEVKELIEKCSWGWTTLNSVNGYRVTGPNGNSIFLPAAGYHRGTGVSEQSSYGYYWSSSLNNKDSNIYYGSNYACCLFLGGLGHSVISNQYRYNGHTVRPVCP